MREMVPIDVDTIRRSAGRVPAFDSIDEAEAYGLLLTGHVQLMLPEAEALPATRDRDGAPHIITWARDTLRQGYGDTVTSASWHVENLAILCRLLLNLVRPEARTEFCAWCQTHSTGVRVVRVFEAGSGPGGSLGACEPCREGHGLTPFVEQSLDESHPWSSNASPNEPQGAYVPGPLGKPRPLADLPETGGRGERRGLPGGGTAPQALVRGLGGGRDGSPARTARGWPRA